jgi:hypothetical protein
LLDVKAKSGFTKSHISLSRYSKFEGNKENYHKNNITKNPMQSAKDYKIKMGKKQGSVWSTLFY